MKGIITGTSMIYTNDDISLYFQRNCESNLLYLFPFKIGSININVRLIIVNVGLIPI